jgi:hypothetical protein
MLQKCTLAALETLAGCELRMLTSDRFVGMTAQVSVRNQDKSFPKSHLELTFWFCLVHVINHSRRRDVKVMQRFGTSQPQRN